MKSRQLNFAAGLVAGAVLFGSGSALAAGLTATPSTQSFYLNDKPVSLEAYVINGNNYVKLRDVGQAAGFNVTYDAIRNAVVIEPGTPYKEEVKTPTPTGVIKIPRSDAKLNLKVGDRVLCDDGSILEIKDQRLYEDPGPLPTPTCDWSRFPEVALPEVRVTTSGTGYVAIMNLYETRRMQYTIYNAVGGLAGRDGWDPSKLKLQMGLSGTDGIQFFWPWDGGDQLTRFYQSSPWRSRATIAWDVYLNGKYLYTNYKIQSL